VNWKTPDASQLICDEVYYSDHDGGVNNVVSVFIFSSFQYFILFSAYVW